MWFVNYIFTWCKYVFAQIENVFKQSHVSFSFEMEDDYDVSFRVL
jgi:hypothetical protein